MWFLNHFHSRYIIKFISVFVYLFFDKICNYLTRLSNARYMTAGCLIIYTKRLVGGSRAIRQTLRFY